MRKILIGIAAVVLLMTIPAVLAQTSDPWTLEVIKPTANEIITTPIMNVHANAHGFHLDLRYAGTPNLADIGHYDELIDGMLIDMSGRPADTISMVGITPGPHILTLVPARNNHSEIMESAVNIPFTYAGPYFPQPGPYYFENPPSLMITSPANGSTVQGGSFDLTVDIQNFVLSAESYGKEMVDGVGHWQIYVDLPPMMMPCTCNHNDPGHMAHMMMMMTHLKTLSSSYSQDISLKGLAKNTYHTFTAILVDNQHMHVMPMVMDMVTLYVAS